MRNRSYLIVGLSALLLGACTKIEKLEKVGLTPASLVVNTVATDGDQLEFSVTKSLNVLDNAPVKALKTAKIKLYENGTLIETVVYNTISESYLANALAKPKTQYKIEVTASGFPTCVSDFFVPETPGFANPVIKIKKDNNQSSGGSMYYDSFNFAEGSMSFVLKDNGSEKNGYLIIMNEKWTQKGGIGQRFGFSYWACKTPEANTFNSFFSSNQSASYYISDDLFQGKEMLIDLKTENNYNQFYNGIDSLLGYEFTIYSLSDGYYKHSLNRQQYEQGKGNFFKEPVYIFSNVSNGFGACGGAAKTTFFVPFKL